MNYEPNAQTGHGLARSESYIQTEPFPPSDQLSVNDTQEIIRNWQDAVGTSPVSSSNSKEAKEKHKWASGLDNLTLVLSEALNETFQDVLTFTVSLRYEALLGITVDNDTTFIFSLQGVAGTPTNKVTGWTRRQLESNQVKIKMEDALCRVCWEQAMGVSSIRLEGTVSIILDNSDVILLQLDQMAFAPMGKVENIVQPINVQPTHAETNISQPSGTTKRKQKNSKGPYKSSFRRKQKHEDQEKKNAENEKDSLSCPEDSFKKEEDATEDGYDHEDPEKEQTSDQVPKIKAKKKSYMCEQCGKSYSCYSSFSFHKKSHLPFQPTVPCEVCNKTFRTMGELKQHRYVHSGDKPFVCENCGKTFNHPSNLMRHRKLHSDHKPYKCDQCKKAYTILNQLKQHQLIHSEEKFRCEFCMKTFHHASSLKQHRRLHSRELGSDDLKEFMCKLCGKTYTNSSGLARHTLVHKGERNFVCKVCNKAFIDKSYFLNHQLLHKDDSPFKCDVCNKSFKWSQYLIRHQRIHTGEKPYKCINIGCDKAFAFTSSLAQHKKNCVRSRVAPTADQIFNTMP